MSEWRIRGRRGAWRHRLAAEDGNTLILMPAGVLVLMVLGAIAADSAVVFQADRKLADVASGLANDAAGMLDEATFYATGDIRIDEGRVVDLIALVVPQLQDDPLTFTCTPTFPGPGTVEVTCTGETELLFAPTVGPVGDLGKVGATARASARTG